jgi:hypothetical protein
MDKGGRTGTGDAELTLKRLLVPSKTLVLARRSAWVQRGKEACDPFVRATQIH